MCSHCLVRNRTKWTDHNANMEGTILEYQYEKNLQKTSRKMTQ